MKIIDKLGRKLAKDFDKQFKEFNEDQLKVLHNTKMYKLLVNKGHKYSCGYSCKPRHSSSTDMDHIKVLEIISQIANDKVKNSVCQELIDSKEPTNIIMAANILNNKFK